MDTEKYCGYCKSFYCYYIEEEQKYTPMSYGCCKLRSKIEKLVVHMYDSAESCIYWEKDIEKVREDEESTRRLCERIMREIEGAEKHKK